METIGAIIIIWLFLWACKFIWKSTEPPPETLEEYWRRTKRK